ncbi:MAG TPA: lytic transglycosylase domain-containing protein [Chakrabartia sp.]|nr:lytic transglycosylase domain-containing protein [Chakrabartia sp.]
MGLKLTIILGLALSIGTGASVQAADQTVLTAPRTYAPQLGPNARARYRQIFDAINARQWTDAQALLDATPEGPLHNVARAELYLAKGSPVVAAETLAALAQRAPELPQARRLVNLAQTRGVSTFVALPSEQELRWLGSQPRRGKMAGSEAKGLTLSGRIVPLLKSDQPNEAEALLDTKAAELDPETLTEWQHRIAWSYFLTGDDLGAQRLAAKAAVGPGDFAAQAQWVAGLASWRLRNYDAASTAFSIAANRLTDPEMVAAAHYWGARADMAGGHPERVDAKLKAATRQSETFYGLLAYNQLGVKPQLVETGENGRVEKLPNVRAALALAEIGEKDLADDIIRYQARIGDARDHATLAAIAGRLDLPGTQLWLAQNGPSGAQASVSARYPAPKSWMPAGGWRVDRSLVFAHALQESRFRTNVVSPAGARGLMQVMPGTAAMISRNKGESSVGSLSDPSVNMEYGQSFIEQMRDRSETGGLLPKVIAAYNAGPLPVSNWNARVRDSGDPLLYIESIPYWETRAYVATVMRNYWMYQLQAGEKPNSMTALSQGMWPRFPGLPGPMAVRLDRVSGTQMAD